RSHLQLHRDWQRGPSYRESARLGADRGRRCTPARAHERMRAMTEDFRSVEALVFDMFGTVVDWRESVAADISSFLSVHLPAVDPREFADAWRAEYQPSMARVRRGGRPFGRLDVLRREN